VSATPVTVARIFPASSIIKEKGCCCRFKTRMSEPNSPIPTSTIEYHHALPVPQYRQVEQRYWLHALLLVATGFTTMVVGAGMEFSFLHNLPPFSWGDEWVPFFPLGWVLAQPSRLLLGIPFSATLLSILFAHEMGHYLCCRYYGVRATLPFFIPAPTLIGTLGAVIRIKGPIRSRAALFDIGIAGPIAGFVVAVGTLAVAMLYSKPLPAGIGHSYLRLGFPPIFYLMQQVLRVFHPYHSITGLPLSRIYLHPTAVAAWFGMYATALNLLPSSQLDGGHIVYAVAPRAHRAVSWLTVIVLVALGRVDPHWWVWAGILVAINLFTNRHQQAPPYPDIPENRWPLALLALLLLLLTFTVMPFQTS
jgi:membrane-associated protease RseP (regulator of RpoE activity)